jgi:hypothetical protein
VGYDTAYGIRRMARHSHARDLVSEVDGSLCGPEHQDVEGHEAHEAHVHCDAGDAIPAGRQAEAGPTDRINREAGCASERVVGER